MIVRTTPVLLFLSLNSVGLLGYAGFLVITGKLTLGKLRTLRNILYDIETETGEHIATEEDLLRKVTIFTDIESRKEDIHAKRVLDLKDAETKLAVKLNEINKIQKELDDLRADIEKREGEFEKKVEERRALQESKGFKKTIRVLQAMEPVMAAEHLGHTDIQTTKRYAHLAESALKQAAMETTESYNKMRAKPMASPRRFENHARHAGFEPAAFGSGDRRSIQLS